MSHKRVTKPHFDGRSRDHRGGEPIPQIGLLRAKESCVGMPQFAGPLAMR
jgi:hypothetical protein